MSLQKLSFLIMFLRNKVLISCGNTCSYTGYIWYCISYALVIPALPVSSKVDIITVMCFKLIHWLTFICVYCAIIVASIIAVTVLMIIRSCFAINITTIALIIVMISRLTCFFLYCFPRVLPPAILSRPSARVEPL